MEEQRHVSLHDAGPVTREAVLSDDPDAPQPDVHGLETGISTEEQPALASR